MIIHNRLFPILPLAILSLTVSNLTAKGNSQVVISQSQINQSETPLMRPVRTGADTPAPIPNLVVVKLARATERLIGNAPKSARTFGLPAVDQILLQTGVQKINRAFPTKTSAPALPLPDLSKIYTLHLAPSSDTDYLIASLNADPNIEYAEYLYPAFTDIVPNDSLYPNQVHYARIMAEAAWDLEQGDPSVVLAIIDTGVDWNHEDLSANIWTNSGEIADNGLDDDGNGYIDDVHGWDFVDVPADWDPDNQPAPGEDGTVPDNDPSDFDGHGTHTAGIAAGVTNNSIGIAGTSWLTSIMPVRSGYLTIGGTGSIAWGYSGIVYAVDNGADIVSLSWGGGGISQMGRDIIDYAWGMGAMIIAAAGNQSESLPHFPSAYDHVLAVAATGTVSDNLASFSNYGTWVDICAPGTSILSTFPNNTYGAIGGTSMSTPMVAGAAALVKAFFPSYSNHEVLMQIVGGADNIDDANPAFAGLLGYGRINLYQSLTITPDLEPNLQLTASFSDAAQGDGDGILEPGETVQLIVTLENQFLGDSATNVNLTFSTTDYALTLQNNTAAFSVIEPLGSVSNNQNPIVVAIEPTCIPHRAVFTVEVSADNGYEETFVFAETIGKAALLLVDDDDGTNNVEQFYFSSLDALGIPFTYWSHVAQGTPENIATQYSTLIWLCEWTFPALDSTDRAEISTFVNNGGNLFLSGQDIGWDLCDASTTFENEYSRSNGASLVWYESNLHAEYIADDATPGGQASLDVTGATGNPIGDGLSFTISQPGRSNENQYPSIISPLSDAQSVFEYSTGGTGATLWSGDYKVINFGFGFEAITDSLSRLTVMDRVLQWLNAFGIDHTPLPDTENSDDPRSVSVTVNSEQAGVDSVAVYWSLDGSVPFNIVSMVESAAGVYSANIPAQSSGTTVHYFIFVQADNDYFLTSPIGAPLTNHSYYVGLDTELPAITALTELSNTIDNSGSYAIEAELEDNLGINQDAVYLHYQLNGAGFDSTNMLYNDLHGSFTGNIDFGASLSRGDSIEYYLSATDASAAANRIESGPIHFTIVNNLLVDDFESGTDNWIINQGWEPYFYAHSGANAITESPTGFYEDNQEYLLENRANYNLANRSAAYLSFWHIYALGSGDSANIEVSTDGIDWTVTKTLTGSNNYTWQNEVVALNDFTGNSEVHFRFRLVADATQGGDGWYIDDITFHVDTTLMALEESIPGLPITYALKQNYPNPFNPATILEYHLPKETTVNIIVYNLLGQVVNNPVNEVLPAGIHKVYFDASELSSGIYFYRIETPAFSKTRKMIVLR